MDRQQLSNFKADVARFFHMGKTKTKILNSVDDPCPATSHWNFLNLCKKRDPIHGLRLIKCIKHSKHILTSTSLQISPAFSLVWLALETRTCIWSKWNLCGLFCFWCFLLARLRLNPERVLLENNLSGQISVVLTHPIGISMSENWSTNNAKFYQDSYFATIKKLQKTNLVFCFWQNLLLLHPSWTTRWY